MDDIKLAGKTQNLDPMWKVLNKEVDLGEPTSFLGHVYLGCTQRQCEISKDIVDKCRTMFESRISAGATEKIPCSENLRISSWSYDMEGHAKECGERYCELANKTTQQLCNVSTALLFRYVGLGTREFVILVPDPIIFGPWSVLLDRGEPCDAVRNEGKATFYSPSEEWIMRAPSTINPEEREFVIPEQACTWSARKTLTKPNWRS